ncbi:hypothetical protein GCK72_004965 [Caenorhabditis remanei]|uniref:Uncharacterized protein n=1 Tax=Caenorhabditis remanei TaxID=31234 RepID=A0A6A5HDU2_CAERE|nr:hypothetical protein GCK72_004965 [Caenorhabditis remanei]KAF1765014.1 hypothetical protein GCK72_004965 [Caenorhabditis remanei]
MEEDMDTYHRFTRNVRLTNIEFCGGTECSPSAKIRYHMEHAAALMIYLNLRPIFLISLFAQHVFQVFPPTTTSSFSLEKGENWEVIEMERTHCLCDNPYNIDRNPGSASRTLFDFLA